MLKIIPDFKQIKINNSMPSKSYRANIMPKLNVLTQDAVSFSGKSKIKLPQKEFKKIFDNALESMEKASDPDEKVKIIGKAIDKYNESAAEFLNKNFSDHASKEHKMLTRGMFHEIANLLSILCAKTVKIQILRKPEVFEKFYSDCKMIFDEIINSIGKYQGYLNRGLGSQDMKLSEIFGQAISSSMKMAKLRNINVEIQGQELLKIPSIKTGIADYELDDVFSNLVQNAVKYNHDGGKVKIKFFEKQNEQGRKILGFSVEDSGIGIPQEDQVNIFRGKRGGNVGNIYGTGLGLRRVKKILGTPVEIESPLNKGAEYPGTRITSSILINE